MSEEKVQVAQGNDDLAALGINGLPRDRAQGWFKFEKIGDAVGGTIRDMFFQEERDGMAAQRVFTLERANGEFWNVALKFKKYVTTRTDALQVGDKLGCRFEKEVPSKFKANPAKSISIMPELIGPRTGENALKLASPPAGHTPTDDDDWDTPAPAPVAKMEGDPFAPEPGAPKKF